MTKLDKNADCAIIYIFGQSNAHAHCQKMEDNDVIKEPMKNVWKLDTADNQSFDLKEAKWSGFTSYDYNLGETQNCTYSMASFLAKKWQARIDAGENLPDLHIVQMSIGGQMIIGGMWQPHYSHVNALTPGTYDICEIALYELSTYLLPIINKSLSKYKNVQSLGLHWIGSEGDTYPGTYDRPDFHDIYYNFFTSLIDKTGFDTPLYLYKVVREKNLLKKNESIAGIQGLTAEYEKLCGLINNCCIVDPRKAPFYDATKEDDGLFSPDLSHYHKYTQEWFADRLIEEIL